MSAKPPLRHEEVQRILGLLEPLSVDRSIVLVGGQAVAFWTRFLQERSPMGRIAWPPSTMRHLGRDQGPRSASGTTATPSPLR
jgi:hypothetical protein